MSLHIRYSLEGSPLFQCGLSESIPHAVAVECRVGPAKRQGLVSAMLEWLRQPRFDGAARADHVVRRQLEFAAPPRETRTLFHAWAASDLAHRDIAGQFWLTLLPN